MPTRRLAFASLPFGLSLALGTSPARAQDDIAADLRPTRGVEIPAGAVVGDADATALELNPGQLGMLSDSSLVLVSNFWPGDAVRPGRGTGLFYGAPFLGSAAVGLGYQWLRPSGTYEADGKLQLDPVYKLQLGFAVRHGSRFGLGVTWNRFWGDGRAIGGQSTWDLGLTLRPYRRLGLGVAVHDLGRPSLGAAGTLQRVWEPEIALRPLANDRLEIAGGVRLGEQKRDFGWHGRLMTRLFDGLRVFAETEAAPFDAVGGNVTDWRFTLGLWVDFEHVGLGVAGVGGSNGGFGPSNERRISSGASVLARYSRDRYPGFSGRRHVERIELADLGSDRKFVDLVLRLRRLQDDGGASGVLLRIEDLDLGLGRIEELRDLVAGLRRSGKTVTAYLGSPGTPEYYLAAACDRIVIPPTGGLWLTGLSQTVTFYKGAMERLGIEVDLVRIAEFKGAMEPYVMTEHTEPVRENKNALLDDSFGRIAAAVADGRKAAGVTPERARALVDKGSFIPEEARTAGLVDDVKPWAEMEKIDGVSVRRPDGSPVHQTGWARPGVAVILVDGTITGGKSQELPFGLEGAAGSETIVAALDEARRNRGVRAVVLRVNSRGGSAEASDDIALAVARVRKAGKPVVVSMGDVAASGGYYVAAPADEILAEPSTTTGSIGIFTFHLDVRSLVDKIGIGTETYNRGARADYFSPYKAWGDDERAMAAESIRHMYERFLQTIVDGRKARGLTRNGVDAIGRGHIWTGSQALGHKLIDRTGGLGAAIDEAARRARLPRGPGGLPEVAVLPRVPQSLLSEVVDVPGVGSLTSAAVGAGSGADAAAPVAAPAMGPADLAARVLGPAARDAARVLAPLVLAGGDRPLALVPYDLRVR